MIKVLEAKPRNTKAPLLVHLSVTVPFLMIEAVSRMRGNIVFKFVDFNLNMNF